ncbi:MAG: hypothetical protein K2N95_03230 [Lachnospiraceae bacterium]|nr:hypothetical protein [Lachnospiraceae bacterium]
MASGKLVWKCTDETSQIKESQHADQIGYAEKGKRIRVQQDRNRKCKGGRYSPVRE